MNGIWLRIAEAQKEIMKTRKVTNGIANNGLKDTFDRCNWSDKTVITKTWIKYAPKLYFDKARMIVLLFSLNCFFENRFLNSQNMSTASKHTFND